LKIGDKVAHIDDNLEGIVSKIDNHKVSFISDEGFVYTYDETKLVVISSDFETVINKQNIIKKDKKSRKKPIEKSIPEFDLHIEKILSKHKHLSASDKLDIQKREIERILNKMKRSHHKEIILIHGHGKNVLKNELIKILKHKSLQYFDASYQKYGGGALRVILK